MRIKEILKEKGMTQKELALKMNTSTSTLSQAINGNATINSLQKIADALEVPISALFDEDSICLERKNECSISKNDFIVKTIMMHLASGNFCSDSFIAEVERVAENIERYYHIKFKEDNQ